MIQYYNFDYIYLIKLTNVSYLFLYTDWRDLIELVVSFYYFPSKIKSVYKTNINCSLIRAIVRTISPQCSWDYNTISLDLRSREMDIVSRWFRGNSVYYFPCEHSIFVYYNATIEFLSLTIICRDIKVFTSMKMLTSEVWWW